MTKLWIMSMTFFCLSGSVLAAPAPFEKLTALDGKPAVLESSKARRLVVFWGTWCDECRAKLGKELVELNQRADLSVITVNADRDDERVREFVAKEHIQLPVLRDPSKEFRRELQVFSVPHWALYRKNPASKDYQLVASEAAFDYEQVLKVLGAHEK